MRQTMVYWIDRGAGLWQDQGEPGSTNTAGQFRLTAARGQDCELTQLNPLLQALVEGKPPESMPAVSPLAPQPKPAIQKLRYNHMAMVDLLVSNPAIDQNDLAEIFDRSASWISNIICSDVFQDMLAKRRTEILGPEILATFKNQHEALLHRSMAILRAKLNKRPEEIPDQLALQVMKVTGQNLGLAHAGEPRVSVQETHVHLEELGSNLVGLLRRRRADAAKEYIDGELSSTGPRPSQPSPSPRSENALEPSAASN